MSRRNTLAQFARKMGLGPLVLLGRGAGYGRRGEGLDSVRRHGVGYRGDLSGGGFSGNERDDSRALAPLVEERATAPGEADYKIRLQELLAQSGLRPRYVIADEGRDHEKLFTAEVFAGDQSLGSGSSPVGCAPTAVRGTAA